MPIEYSRPKNYAVVLVAVLRFRASIGRTEALFVATR